MKILLVEDEKRLAHLLREAIGDYFADFEIAYDGIEGLEQFRKVKPDVVITDITMPKMTGLVLAEKIRKESPDTPIVILSAYSDKEKLLGAIDVGVVKYFIKPFDPEELIDYLCKLADRIKKQSLIQLLEPFTYDLQSEQLFRKGVLVHLSKRESRFIAQLLYSPNHYLSNEMIKERLWEGEEVSDERLRTFIKRVRQKSDKRLIENVSGQGYVLRLKESSKTPGSL
ncbi:response regulator transcription factor [Hydrogenimonas sp.]|uniref:response regulator transcription factor n=1 Tax=Hydrogenimonas sp. TaxID=2231112 RepID=UPI002601CFAA|nr:response regulator transcription factor [Hydrogenimonas sp.]